MTVLRTRRTAALAAIVLTGAVQVVGSPSNQVTRPPPATATLVTTSDAVSTSHGLGKGKVTTIAVVCSVVPVLLALLAVIILLRIRGRRARAARAVDHGVRGPYPLGSASPREKSPPNEKSYHRARTASSFSTHTHRPRAGTTASIPSMLVAADAPSALSPAPSISRSASLLSRSPSLFSSSSPGYRNKRMSQSNPNLACQSHGYGFYTTRSSRMTQSQATFKSFATVSEYDPSGLPPIPDLPIPIHGLPTSTPPPRPPRPDTAIGFVPTYLIPDMESSLGHGSDDYASGSVDHSARSFKYDSLRSHSTTSHSVSGSISISSPFVDCPPSLVSHPFNRTQTVNGDASPSSFTSLELPGSPQFPEPTALSRHSSVPRSPLRPPPRPKPTPPPLPAPPKA